MTNSAEITDGSSEGAPAGRPKVRFQGVVESAEDGEIAEYRSFEDWAAGADRGERQAARLGRELFFASRILSVFLFALFMVGWPAMATLGYYNQVGSFKGYHLGLAYGDIALVVGFVVSPSLWLLGYLALHIMNIIGRSEAVAVTAQQLLQPDRTAVENVQTVGSVVREQMDALNAGIDDALIRLASAEAMIRQHVGAIEQAGAAVESKTSKASERVASERARLIELTEALNARADDFATAIAQKAQSSIEAMQSADDAGELAEAQLHDRLARLETAAQRALMSFEALNIALSDADEHMRLTSGAVEASAADVKKASELAARIADAAAESAARNAANVGMSANQAAERARKAAEDAIESARVEAARASETAIEFATREAQRVTEAAARAVEGVQSATKGAVESAAADAEKAASAANLVSDAAKLATSAAREASDEVRKASEFAKKSADDAISFSKTASENVAKRNEELAAARASLEAENTRLESLIEEQRRRADRLAEAIATQTERLSKLAENQLREQEAAARLVEAQAAMQKARAADIEREEQTQAAAKARMEEFERTAKAEAETKKSEAAAKKERVAREQREAASNVLDLGDSARMRNGARTANKPSGETTARLDELAAEISRVRPNGKTGGKPDAGANGEKNGAGRAQPERPNKDGVTWREILTATDDAEPLDLGAASRRKKEERAKANDAIRIISGLQSFTLDLETRLYGDPPPALLERFERGDRNAFANRILRLNESDVKRRIRAESARDKTFERGIHDFLHGFEQLLEDATTSQTADEELEEYLSSPLGRVYLLVGATVGYFA
ncbi:MAG: hypothetical protein R3C42_00240 [Parvularculaceae bacterium]|nr:hypothetical protein [Parvularculaceae bacterium]